MTIDPQLIISFGVLLSAAFYQAGRAAGLKDASTAWRQNLSLGARASESRIDDVWREAFSVSLKWLIDSEPRVGNYFLKVFANTWNKKQREAIDKDAETIARLRQSIGAREN